MIRIFMLSLSGSDRMRNGVHSVELLLLRGDARMLRRVRAHLKPAICFDNILHVTTPDNDGSVCHLLEPGHPLPQAEEGHPVGHPVGLERGLREWQVCGPYRRRGSR